MGPLADIAQHFFFGTGGNRNAQPFITLSYFLKILLASLAFLDL